MSRSAMFADDPTRIGRTVCGSNNDQPTIRSMSRSVRVIAVFIALLLASTSCAADAVDSATLDSSSAAPATAEAAESTDRATPETTNDTASNVDDGVTAQDEAAEVATPETDSLSTATETPIPVVADGTSQITVDSTTDDYFVLYVRPSLEDGREIPVSITLGNDGSTVLTDGRDQLPMEYYRVETRAVSSPGDVDEDGVDDLTELADAFSNPLHPGMELAIQDGTLMVPDRETFELLSYQGDDVMRDGYLAGLEFVKFTIVETDGPNPALYFMNTENHRAHPFFAQEFGLPGGRRPGSGTMRGDIVYNPDGVAPDGAMGTYRFAFQPNDAFSYEDIALAFEMLTNGMPFLSGNLLYEPYPSAALPLYERELASYEAYRIPILLVAS